MPVDPDSLPALIDRLCALRERALVLEERHAGMIASLPPETRDSGRNLIHYAALRQVDLRALQDELARQGLSSLGRMESCVLATLDAVLGVLQRITGRAVRMDDEPPVAIGEGAVRIARQTERMFGPAPAERATRIMVTMPGSAATDPMIIQRLVVSGMDVMRINCAHDGPEDWLAMIDHLRRAERALGRRCKVHVDLAGPKLRTGRLRPEGRLLHVRPVRDSRGRTLHPARVWLVPDTGDGMPPNALDAALPLTGSVVRQARTGDYVVLKDCRGRQRRLRIAECHDGVCLAICDRSLYLETGLAVELRRGARHLERGRIGNLPESIVPLRLLPDDRLVLTAPGTPGEPAIRDPTGKLLMAARIACENEAVFRQIRTGDMIEFDDGRIAGEVLGHDALGIDVRITRTPPKGGKLGPGKGINLPGSVLDLPALTDDDLLALDVLAEHADLVGMSFIRHPDDIEQLNQALVRRGIADAGIVLKIETRQAFERLPQVLLTALRSPPVAVMVARGDLAAELGFARLAEVQEEILWFCEAGHIPVIWATQVLEQLAKQGLPSRAEVSDAALGIRSECVMLNKGAYIVEAVQFLDGVLRRMSAHQHKKRSMLRPLAIADMDQQD